MVLITIMQGSAKLKQKTGLVRCICKKNCLGLVRSGSQNNFIGPVRSGPISKKNILVRSGFTVMAESYNYGNGVKSFV